MEFFRSVNVNWLGWKWYFLGLFHDLQRGRHREDELELDAHRQPGSAGRGLSRRHAGGSAVRTRLPTSNAIRHAIDAAGVKDAQHPELRRSGESRSAHQPA